MNISEWGNRLHNIPPVVEPRVTVVAAPLQARSGVYRSARETVNEARAKGLDWSLFLGVSDNAKGQIPTDDPPWIVEEIMESQGAYGVSRLARRLSSESMPSADLTISMNPQCDMALAMTRRPWVAYIRGLPWPADGESGVARASAWKHLELLALRRAVGIWVTTDVLRDQVPSRLRPNLVPAGIHQRKRTWDGRGERSRVIWAARFDKDKNPAFFQKVMATEMCTDLHGVMFGSGPLYEEIAKANPDNVSMGGWVAPGRLWDGALAYAGTSHREAFGRSAVEAAMSGVPVVLADSFGAANLLITDADLRKRFVLPVGAPTVWAQALSDLKQDEGLRQALSDHAYENSTRLSIESSVSSMRDQIQVLGTSSRTRVANGPLQHRSMDKQ